MHEDRPHLCVLGEVEPLPALTAVRAAVRATARAEIDHVRVRRVHGDRLDVGHLRQPLGQTFPAIVTGRLPEDTADRLGADCCRTDIDVRAGHGRVLSWVAISGPRPNCNSWPTRTASRATTRPLEIGRASCRE